MRDSKPWKHRCTEHFNPDQGYHATLTSAELHHSTTHSSVSTAAAHCSASTLLCNLRSEAATTYMLYRCMCTNTHSHTYVVISTPQWLGQVDSKHREELPSVFYHPFAHTATAAELTCSINVLGLTVVCMEPASQRLRALCYALHKHNRQNDLYIFIYIKTLSTIITQFLIYNKKIPYQIL